MSDDTTTPDTVIVARVSESDISITDLALRQSMDRLYEPATVIGRAVTTSALLKEAVDREVARLNKIKVTANELESIGQQTGQTNPAFDLLANIKALFGADTDAYRRLFLEPKITPNKLREHFAQLPAQLGTRTKVEKALADVLAGASMADAAKKYGLNYEKSTLKEPDVSTLPEMPGIPDDLPLLQDPLLKIIKTLKPGECHSEIIDTGLEHAVVQLDRLSGAEYMFQKATINKPVYEEWFKKQVAKLEIVINDPALFNQIREKYGHVWWLANVKSN